MTTETSVVAFPSSNSIDRLSDSEQESVQVQINQKIKSKEGLSFFHRKKYARSNHSSTTPCQIEVQDCRNLGASSNGLSLPIPDESNGTCSFSLEQTGEMDDASASNSPEKDDDALLNDSLCTVHPQRGPLELRSITRSTALFGGMDGFNSFGNTNAHLHPASLVSHNERNVGGNSMKANKKLVLTTDL